MQKIDVNNLKIGDSITLASRKYKIIFDPKIYYDGAQQAGLNHPMERWIRLGTDLPPDEIFHTLWHEIEHLINHLIGLRKGPDVEIDSEAVVEAKEHYQVQAIKQIIEWQQPTLKDINKKMETMAKDAIEKTTERQVDYYPDKYRVEK
jgi:hypothetical protein